MIDHPFQIFDPYRDHIDIRWYAKNDKPAFDDDYVSLNQVHGNTTLIARSPIQREKNADGVLTDQTDLTLTIRVADCQAFVIYAPQKNVIGLLHAGWKGLVNGAIPAFVNEIQSEWDIDPSTLLVGASPSLCINCAQFTDPRTELGGINDEFFHGRNADLRAIADDQWVGCGVSPSHIERNTDCTKCSRMRYWTYRGGDREAVIKGSTNILTCTLKKRK